MLDLHRLRLLREFDAHGTVAAAAAAVGYTPSAVSQQLAVLEREAGVKLLARAGRGVRLTDAGRVLVRHADALLAAAEEAEADLARASGVVAGTIRVSAFQTAVLHLVIPAVAVLAREHPDLRVEIVEAEAEDALPDLRRQRLDLVIVDEYDGVPLVRPADLRRELLLREEVRLILPAGHRLARTNRPPALADLAGEVWSSGQHGSGQHALVLDTCRALGGFEPDLRHVSNDLRILLDLVRTLGVVALLPDLVHTAGDDTVVARTPAERALHRDVTVLTRRSSASRPALEAFRAALQREAARASRGRRAS